MYISNDATKAGAQGVFTDEWGWGGGGAAAATGSRALKSGGGGVGLDGAKLRVKATKLLGWKSTVQHTTRVFSGCLNWMNGKPAKRREDRSALRVWRHQNGNTR